MIDDVNDDENTGDATKYHTKGELPGPSPFHAISPSANIRSPNIDRSTHVEPRAATPRYTSEPTTDIRLDNEMSSLQTTHSNMTSQPTPSGVTSESSSNNISSELISSVVTSLPTQSRVTSSPTQSPAGLPPTQSRLTSQLTRPVETSPTRRPSATSSPIRPSVTSPTPQLRMTPTRVDVTSSQPTRLSSPLQLTQPSMTLQQPLRFRGTSQPTQSSMISVPTHLGVTSQTTQSSMISVPTHLGVTSQPIRFHATSQLIQASTTSHPIRFRQIPQPTQSGVTSHQTKSHVTSYPTISNVTSQPRRYRVISKPTRARVRSEPTRTRVLSEPTRTRVLSEPIRFRVTSQSVTSNPLRFHVVSPPAQLGTTLPMIQTNSTSQPNRSHVKLKVTRSQSMCETSKGRHEKSRQKQVSFARPSSASRRPLGHSVNDLLTASCEVYDGIDKSEVVQTTDPNDSTLVRMAARPAPPLPQLWVSAPCSNPDVCHEVTTPQSGPPQCRGLKLDRTDVGRSAAASQPGYRFHFVSEIQTSTSDLQLDDELDDAFTSDGGTFRRPDDNVGSYATVHPSHLDTCRSNKTYASIPPSDDADYGTYIHPKSLLRKRNRYDDDGYCNMPATSQVNLEESPKYSESSHLANKKNSSGTYLKPLSVTAGDHERHDTGYFNVG